MDKVGEYMITYLKNFSSILKLPFCFAIHFQQRHPQNEMSAIAAATVLAMTALEPLLVSVSVRQWYQSMLTKFSTTKNIQYSCDRCDFFFLVET